jgi:transcription factor IIIB subunit 2
LEFEEKNYAVISDALRLVSRMDRDWIKLGRRPAGICAAGSIHLLNVIALFIAARMNGMNRTIQEIVHVVKICGATLRKRLEEFGNTDSAALTVDMFTKVWLDSSKDPPCFSQLNDDLKGKRKRVESDASDGTDDRSDTAYATGSSEDGSRATSLDLGDEMKAALQDDHLIKITKQLDASDTGDADLTALDDDWEVANAIITEDEAKFKSEIWESLNFEYTEKNKRECFAWV